MKEADNMKRIFAFMLCVILICVVPANALQFTPAKGYSASE